MSVVLQWVINVVVENKTLNTNYIHNLYFVVVLILKPCNSVIPLHCYVFRSCTLNCTFRIIVDQFKQNLIKRKRCFIYLFFFTKFLAFCSKTALQIFDLKKKKIKNHFQIFFYLQKYYKTLHITFTLTVKKIYFLKVLVYYSEYIY